jgi:alanine dehydrogenase
MDSAIDAVEQATIDFYRGRVREANLADQTQGSDPSNLLQIHFSANDDAVSGFQVFAETRGGGGPSLTNSRYVVLLDSRTRQLLAIVDYSCLSPLRVGASAGVGCRHLAAKGARVAGILGSSKQARAQLQAIQRSVPTLERARVFSPTPEHREAFAREMTEWLDLPVEAMTTAQGATEGADIVGLANNSRVPVLDLPWVKPGALVISISGGQLPVDVIAGPRIVSTTWESLAARQPYASHIAAGTYSKDEVAADIGAVILGEATVRRSPVEIVVFELSRINMWSVAVAHWAYESALAEGVGTSFTLSAEGGLP